MALTRKALRDMGLTAQQVDEIIAAHMDSIDAVKSAAATEAAELRSQLEALRSSSQEEQRALQAAFDDFRTQTTRKEKHALLLDALLAAGAHPAAAPLLASTAPLDAMALENGALSGAEEAISSLKNQWAGLFAQETTQPLPALNPPGRAHAILTKKDLESMSIEDINAHWGMVSGVLGQQ